jgi:hypothetical protein
MGREIIRRERENRDRAALAPRELHLEGLRGVAMHHRPDVTGFEPTVRTRPAQDDRIQLSHGFLAIG